MFVYSPLCENRLEVLCIGISASPILEPYNLPLCIVHYSNSCQKVASATYPVPAATSNLATLQGFSKNRKNRIFIKVVVTCHVAKQDDKLWTKISQEPRNNGKLNLSSKKLFELLYRKCWHLTKHNFARGCGMVPLILLLWYFLQFSKHSGIGIPNQESLSIHTCSDLLFSHYSYNQNSIAMVNYTIKPYTWKILNWKF